MGVNVPVLIILWIVLSVVGLVCESLVQQFHSVFKAWLIVSAAYWIIMGGWHIYARHRPTNPK